MNSRGWINSRNYFGLSFAFKTSPSWRNFSRIYEQIVMLRKRQLGVDNFWGSWSGVQISGGVELVRAVKLGRMLAEACDGNLTMPWCRLRSVDSLSIRFTTSVAFLRILCVFQPVFTCYPKSHPGVGSLLPPVTHEQYFFTELLIYFGCTPN